MLFVALFSIGTSRSVIYHEKAFTSFLPTSQPLFSLNNAVIYFHIEPNVKDRLCGLVVRVLGYRSGDPGSIPGITRKKHLWVWNGVHSVQLRSYLIEK
jgi:hypothetical protein